MAEAAPGSSRDQTTLTLGNPIGSSDPIPAAVPPSGSSASRQRFPRMVFIDVARSIAILIALAAHSVAVFSVWPALPAGVIKTIGNGIFVTATPTFFLLFGVMLELVYVRRREREGAVDVSGRLAGRAVWCWLGLILGMVCAWVSGRLQSAQMPDALLNLIDTPNSGILRFYSAALLVCIPVVIWRPRFGPGLPLALVAAIWIGAAFMPLLPWPAEGSRWWFLSGFFFGHPPAWSAGSLWHNLSVVFLGMALGYHMRTRLHQGLPPLGGRPVQALVVGCVLGIAVCAWALGPLELAQGYFGTGRVLRSACHPAYFLISTLCSLAMIWVVQRCYPVSLQANQIRLPIIALGRQSLFAFAIGNAALNLFPANLALPMWLGLVGSGLFLISICVATYAVDVGMRRFTRVIV